MPIERLTLTFNVDKEAVVRLILEALHVLGDAHSEEMTDKGLAVVEALLAED